MKKSILFILPDLNAGGAERIVTTIANHLPREKFSPSIILLRKEGLYLDFLQNDVEIIDIKTPRIRHALKPILQQIRKRKPDIVFLCFVSYDASLGSVECFSASIAFNWKCISPLCVIELY